MSSHSEQQLGTGQRSPDPIFLHFRFLIRRHAGPPCLLMSRGVGASVSCVVPLYLGGLKGPMLICCADTIAGCCKCGCGARDRDVGKLGGGPSVGTTTKLKRLFLLAWCNVCSNLLRPSPAWSQETRISRYSSKNLNYSTIPLNTWEGIADYAYDLARGSYSTLLLFDAICLVMHLQPVRTLHCLHRGLTFANMHDIA